jgi:hypothetical protein
MRCGGTVASLGGKGALTEVEWPLETRGKRGVAALLGDGENAALEIALYSHFLELVLEMNGRRISRGSMESGSLDNREENLCMAWLAGWQSVINKVSVLHREVETNEM